MTVPAAPRKLAGMRPRLPVVLLVLTCAVPACRDPERVSVTQTVPRPAADTAAEPETDASQAADGPWLDFTGTSVLGFGVLRLVPPADGPGTFRITYRDTPEDGYSITDNAQLFVLPGDAFAAREMAYAEQFLAFARTPPYEEDYVPEALELTAEVTVPAETTVIVAYGPWTGPDTGRPPGDDPTFSLRVEALAEGGSHAWVESEAGELITTNWTPRPGVERGEPVRDPVTGDDLWIEVRPLILYDAAIARAAGEPPAPDLGDAPTPADLLAQAEAWERDGQTALAADARERAADLAALGARRDRRIVLTPELTERFRRVPIRWR